MEEVQEQHTQSKEVPCIFSLAVLASIIPFQLDIIKKIYIQGSRSQDKRIGRVRYTSDSDVDFEKVSVMKLVVVCTCLIQTVLRLFLGAQKTTSDSNFIKI